MRDKLTLMANLTLCCAAVAVAAPGWAAARQGSAGMASVQHGIDLVESGRCREALPLLKHGLPLVSEKAVRYHAEMATVRCAMALDQEQTAVDTLLMLKRESPDDPEVLYIATHLFSELGMRAAQELQERAPNSYQVQRLQAESLESQGKNDEAAAIYRQILAKNPKVPGIHYRLGQIDLAEAGASGSTDEARQEFEKEAEVDPSNASAEFVLGELARRGGQWGEAAKHFSRATQLDAGFSEAYLGMGMSLAAWGKFAEAKAPLEAYVKLRPDDPAGHYQLAIADARTGDKDGAAREMALQVKAANQSKNMTDGTAGHAVEP
jgi:tetratricopeptide (TPR) repeat protein